MLLQEIASGAVIYKVTKHTNDRFRTLAILGSREVTFTANLEDEGNDVWAVTFFETTEKGGQTFGATGSGKEFEVASFVAQSLTDFVASFSPAVIQFSSHKSEESRSRIYAKLTAKILPQYKMEKTDDPLQLGHGEVMFTLTRK